MGGTNLGEWKQSPPPKTYKEKYQKLKDLIMSRYSATATATERYKDRHDELRNLTVLINTMERKK